MAEDAGNGESVKLCDRKRTGAVYGRMPVVWMVGLAVAAGVGTVQFRRSGV